VSEIERRETSVLAKAFGLRQREVISLTGAGGKTTLMFLLARELFVSGKRVVTTTTTKILEPRPGETASLVVDESEEDLKQFVEKHLDQYKHLTIATERLGSDKLKGVSSELVDELWGSKRVDYIIVEADGAAGRPVKAPREKEPVIPSNTTVLVAILGVDGIGMEINDENVFQAGRVAELTGIPMGEKLTEEGAAVLLTHPEGILKGIPFSSKGIVFLNKVDVPHGMKVAKKTAQKIIGKRHPQIDRVVLGQLRKEPPWVEVIFSS